jgi:hypothetical protein
MSQYNASGHKGWKATAAIARGLAVKIASGEVVVATAATDKIVGVTTRAVTAGDVADVRLRSAQGTSVVKLAGTVAVGDAVTSNGAGALITTTTAGNQVVGIALEAGVTGDLIEVMTSTNTL